MRKYHQKQLLELVKTLYEAHAEVKRLLSNGETPAVIGLLSGCQESAVRIGRFIEQLEGEGKKTVAFLEEYCELLYQLSVAINESGRSAGILKQLQKQLFTIENSIKAELRPDKIEVVFLPYQLSMFDSFESIYLAAKADPNCSAYVVPIPYYELNTDGSFGKMHYDGGKYPPNIEVADWREYNMETRRPDIIFTHYPYDDNTTNISIHPDFYSKRLKDFTDLLCYVPYYVAFGDTLEEYNGFLPGIVYANRVIVESEALRKSYIDHYRKADRNLGWNWQFGKAEEKFIALGSPKYDKVINSKREDFKLPEEWLQRLDGKKVILLNTHMFAWLNGGEQYFEKLRYIFNIFRGRRDVVLWWRPHPNTEMNFRLKRPQLLSEYHAIIDEFKGGDWGIYDDTPDLHRAIAWSDAYYGNGSSLVPLYLSTGKPVMIQNVNISQRGTKPERLIFENLYDDGEAYWFTAYDFNALFKMDKETWKTEYMGSFPGEPIDGKRLYGQIAASGGKLYFAPFSAQNIAEYDPGRGIFRQIKFDETIAGSNIEYKFYEIVTFKERLFFVGFAYPAIVCLDTKTGVTDTYTEWLTPFERLVPEREKYYFRSACVTGPYIVMAALNANAVVAFDMNSCTSEVYEVGGKESRYSGICFDGEDYWLAPRSGGPVVRWNPRTSYKEYENFPDGFVGSRLSFWNNCYSNGHVWLFPYKANMALKINVQDGSISAAEEFMPECLEIGSASSYIFSKAREGLLVAFTGKSNRLITYDCDTRQRREGYVYISEEDIPAFDDTDINIFHNKKNMECLKPKDCMFYESRNLLLEKYIDDIVHFGAQAQAAALSAQQIEICQDTIQNADGTSGKTMYAYCTQLLLKNEGGKG